MQVGVLDVLDGLDDFERGRPVIRRRDVARAQQTAAGLERRPLPSLDDQANEAHHRIAFGE
jgi:hypothetical protein